MQTLDRFVNQAAGDLDSQETRRRVAREIDQLQGRPARDPVRADSAPHPDGNRASRRRRRKG